MSVRRKLSVAFAVILIAVGACLMLRRPPASEQLYRDGWNALQRGHWSRVSTSIRNLKDRPDALDQVRVLRGGLLLRTGDPAAAMTELSRVRSDGSEGVRALLLICEALYSQKHWISAEVAALEVLRRQPDDVEAHRWLGAIYYDLGAMSHSEEHLKKVAELAPTDYASHRLLGLMHKDFERYREAIADYQAALERQPPEDVRREILVELAQSQMKHNDYAGAAESLKITWPKEAIEPQALQAECQWSLGQKELAQQALSKLRAESPRHTDILRLTAKFALDDGRPAEAIEPLKQLIELDPHNDQTLMELSAAYRRLGQEAEADQFLQRRNATRALMEEFVDLNKRAINEPSNADLREQIALKCELLGKKELAAVWRDAARALREQTPRAAE